MTLPSIYQPSEVAQRLGTSERRVRERARTLGACYIFGNRMRFSEEDAKEIAASLCKDWHSGHPLEVTAIERPETAVYFVYSRGYIKIGWSENWKSRVSNIQTSNPEPIEVLLVLGRPQIFEKTMHAQFAEHRASGEWFRDHPNIRAYIEKHKDECWRRSERRK